MRQEVGTRIKTDSTPRSALRAVGRAALWTGLAVLVGRALISGGSSGPQPTRDASAVSGDPAGSAFAVRFARAYLSDPRPQALAPLLAEGAKAGTGTPPTSAGPDHVLQAEVVGIQRLDGDRSILTVACELRDARVLNIAVPIVRSGAGEVAALGAPSIVAASGAAGVESTERPQPIAGQAAASIEALVARFLPEYLAASDPGTLSYLLAPGAVVLPLAGAVGLAAISGVRQLGTAEGARRALLVSARVSDPASGASYPVAYRLSVRQAGGDGRWYVDAVEGAPS